MGRVANFVNFGFGPESAHAEEGCLHRVYVFPTDSMKLSYKTDQPILYAGIVFSIFVFTAIVFLVYDCFVTSRQSNTEKHAHKSDSIVQELFPGHVAAQVFESRANRTSDDTTDQFGFGFGAAPSTTIAELYPFATVLCKKNHF